MIKCVSQMKKIMIKCVSQMSDEIYKIILVK